MLFALAALVSFLLYLLLTAGSGSIFYWSAEELSLGAVFSLAAGLVSWRVLSKLGAKAPAAFMNPARWVLFIVYIIGPFLFAMTKANLDVAFRVITGKINPGIVKIKPKLKTDLGITMLANSITLTPGTLSVEIGRDRSLYVHCINLKNRKPEMREVCGNFPYWIRRITE